jgi:hypothetical protein
MEGFDNEEKSVYMQQGAAVRRFGKAHLNLGAS